jgi:hypothetical protein
VGNFIGIEKISAYKQVIKIVKNHHIGDVIPTSAIGTLNQVILRVFAVTDSQEEMKKLMRAIINDIDVLSDAGKSVLMPTFNVDEL